MSADTLLVRPRNVYPCHPEAQGSAVRYSVVAPELYFNLGISYRVRKETGDSRYFAPIEQEEKDLLGDIFRSCTTPFSECYGSLQSSQHKLILDRTELLFYDRMSLLLDLWYVRSVLAGELVLCTIIQEFCHSRDSISDIPGVSRHIW